MVQLKIALKKSELESTCNNKVTSLETRARSNYTLACNSDDYSLPR